MTIRQYKMMEFVILKKGRKESSRIMITEFKKADFSEVREAAARASQEDIQRQNELQQNWLLPNKAALKARQQPPVAKERQAFPRLLLGSLRMRRNKKNPPENQE